MARGVATLDTLSGVHVTQSASQKGLRVSPLVSFDAKLRAGRADADRQRHQLWFAHLEEES